MERIRVSHYMPEDHGTHADFIVPWARAVEADAGPDLAIEVLSGSSAFGKLGNQYAQVVARTVDIAHSPGWLPEGRFPLTLLAGLPFMAASSAQGTALLNGLFAEHLAGEYEGLKVLALHADSGAVLHTRDELVLALEQLRGLRLRCPAGPVEAAIAALGAIPVPLAPPDIRAAAEDGRIDGAVMAWDVLAYTGTSSIFRFHTDTRIYVSPLYFVMNTESFRDLSPRARAALDRCSGPALASRFPAWWKAWEAPGRALGLAAGQAMGTLSPAELARWRARAAPSVEAHVDALAASGHPTARAAYRAALALRDQFLAHQDP